MPTVTAPVYNLNTKHFPFEKFLIEITPGVSTYGEIQEKIRQNWKLEPTEYNLTNNRQSNFNEFEKNFHSDSQEKIMSVCSNRGFCVLPLFNKTIIQEKTYSFSLNSDSSNNIGITTETPFVYVLWEIIATDFDNKFNPCCFTITRVHKTTYSEKKTTSEVIIKPTEIFMKRFPIEENRPYGNGFSVWFRLDSVLEEKPKETVAEKRARLTQKPSIFGSSSSSTTSTKPVSGLAKYLQTTTPPSVSGVKRKGFICCGEGKMDIRAPSQTSMELGKFTEMLMSTSDSVDSPASPPSASKKRKAEDLNEENETLCKQLEQANKKMKQQQELIQQQQETIKKYEENFLQLKHVLSNF